MTDIHDRAAFRVYCAPELKSWLDGQAEALGTSRSDAVVGMLAAYRKSLGETAAQLQRANNNLPDDDPDLVIHDFNWRAAIGAPEVPGPRPPPSGYTAGQFRTAEQARITEQIRTMALLLDCIERQARLWAKAGTAADLRRPAGPPTDRERALADAGRYLAYLLDHQMEPPGPAPGGDA